MNTNETLEQAWQDLLGLVYKGQVCLAAFLEEKLPPLYKPDNQTLWEHRVDRHLTPLQKSNITKKRINALDLAGLLKVLLKFGQFVLVSRSLVKGLLNIGRVCILTGCLGKTPPLN